MATTPNASPSTANVTGSGTTATTSTINITANSAATLAAAQSAIKQATGNAPPNTFAVGSTTNVSQGVPGGRFVQGSVTTPRLNAAAAASPPPTNNGVSSSISVQNILGLAALAGAGLSVFNNVFGGTNLSQTLVNNSNTATPATSTNNVQDPAQRAQAAVAVPSTGSTNNVSDPAQRAQAAEQAAATVTTPNTNSTNNVTDPAQRAQVADQVAIDNAQNVSTLQDPAQRQQAAITNADNAAPAQVSTFSDPAQRAQAADQAAIDQAATTNNVQDPAQRAQAAAENVTSDSTTLSDAETSQLFAVDEDPFAAAESTTLSDAETSQLFAVEEDPFPNSETTVLSDEETAQLFAQVDEETIESPFPEEILDDATGVDEETIESPFPEEILDDGSLEFAGIDEQIADNENGLQEPPLLSDEEIDQQLQAAQDGEEEIVDQQSAEVDELSAYPPGDQGDQPNEEIADQKSAEVDELSAYPPYETPPTEEPEADNPQDGADQSGFNGATGDERNTQSQATQQDVSNFAAKPDWRVKLRLSPGAKYLYNADPPGILAPLQATDGVIFPYTPAISVQYAASYDPTELTHSNYKFFTYRSSAVDSISIGCDFTAQDTSEAEYLLAVIHFFRSLTKMFYGQDQNPKNGTPPPLCYLTGLGAFQFDEHPLAITGFTYTLPTDVDYIKAGSTATPAGVNRGNNPSQPKSGGSGQAGAARLSSSGINPGAVSAPPDWQRDTGTKEPTYVPTKISLSITAIPIVTRNDISNKFSLTEYATGALLRGSKRAGGGIW